MPKTKKKLTELEQQLEHYKKLWEMQYKILQLIKYLKRIGKKLLNNLQDIWKH